MNRQLQRENWAASGAMAMKAGAILSVLSLIAVVATHAPGGAEEMQAVAANPPANAAG